MCGGGWRLTAYFFIQKGFVQTRDHSLKRLSDLSVLRIWVPNLFWKNANQRENIIVWGGFSSFLKELVHSLGKGALESLRNTASTESPTFSSYSPQIGMSTWCLMNKASFYHEVHNDPHKSPCQLRFLSPAKVWAMPGLVIFILGLFSK